MSNAAFKSNFAKILAAAGNKAGVVVRFTALELQSMMIEKSPVDTGRFKGNFQAGVGSPNLDTSSAPGSNAKGRTQAVLQGWKPGQTIFLTNNMAYAQRLENGWSKQAPSGMVRLSVQNYSSALKKAVEGFK